MSEVSHGPGWWQASDGRWYAPELHPNYSPPPYPPPIAPVKRKSKKVMLTLVVVLAVAVVGTVAVVSVVVARRVVTGRYFTIPSDAMAPALKIGDTVHVERGSVVRGDIVAFVPPSNEHCGGPNRNDLIKRVIGLPGDDVSLMGGYVSINGRRLNEKWLPASEQGVTQPGPSNMPYSLDQTYRVPPKEYFVLGDNRTDSCDSRYWGPVQKSLIVGEVVGISGP